MPPTTEDGLPDTMEGEDGKLLYFAYWDGDYTNVTEDRDVFAIYTPLVTLVTYDKTGNAPNEPNEMQLPCLTTPDLPQAETLEDGYSTAWFMSSEGNVISDTPFEQPNLEDTEISEYEFIYARYTVIPFTLLKDEETSYSANYTLICTTSVEDNEEIGDDEVIEEVEVDEEAEGNEVIEDEKEIHYRYSLFIQSPDDDGETTSIDLQEYVFDPIYSDFPVMIFDVPLNEWRFTITSDGEVSPALPLEELVSRFENSGDTPLLISSAEAGYEPSDEEPVLSDGE